MRRPVYGFGLAFCLACLAGAFVPLPALWLAAAFCAGAFAVFWRMPAGRRRFYRPSTCAYFISSAVSRAIMISSLVGTTHTSTLLSAPEMRTSSPRLLLAARSAVTPR